MENNKQNATLFIYQWVDDNVVPDDTGKLSDMLIAYGNKLNIPDVSGILIAWEKFKKDNWYESESVDVEKMLMDKFQAIYYR